MSNNNTATRTVALPSAKFFVGGTYALCVLASLAYFTSVILFTEKAPYSNDGPVESLIVAAIIGTVALVLGVVVAATTVRNPERARVGAIVLGALSVLTVLVFWSGAPGVLGACAAWLAGLTRGGRPLDGAARVAGLVGAFIALLNVVLLPGTFTLDFIADKSAFPTNSS